MKLACLLVAGVLGYYWYRTGGDFTVVSTVWEWVKAAFRATTGLIDSFVAVIAHG